jgi:glycosyltransferase involved in cell wall biosynthesis
MVLQTFRDYEMIIVDDASNDKRAYAKLIAAYRKRIPGLRYFRNKANRKAPFCRNFAIQAARHPLIAIVDDDDELLPDKLKLQAEAFRDHWDETEIVYSWVVAKNEEGRVLYRVEPRVEGNCVREKMKHGFFPPTSALMFKRAALLKVGLFDESQTTWEDWDIRLRLFRDGARCRPVPKTLTVYHLRDDGMTNSPEFYAGAMVFLRKHWRLFLRHRPSALVHLLLIAFSRKFNIRPVKRFRRIFSNRPSSLPKSPAAVSSRRKG